MNEETIIEKFEESFEDWKTVQDLSDMSIRDVYECAFRHGVNAAEETERARCAAICAEIATSTASMFASTKDAKIARLQKDADRFAFMVANDIKCGKRKNGYWEATSETKPMIPWVSRKTLAECINVLMALTP